MGPKQRSGKLHLTKAVIAFEFSGSGRISLIDKFLLGSRKPNIKQRWGFD
jgi:hypothetical protein